MPLILIGNKNIGTTGFFERNSNESDIEFRIILIKNVLIGIFLHF